jgi:hypothetical protein
MERLFDDSITVFYEAPASTVMRFVRFNLDYLEGRTHLPETTHYDGFGNFINAQNGGMGWSGSWSAGATFTSDYVPEFGGSSVLFSGLNSEYGRVDLAGGQSISRALATPIDMNSNSTTYVSLTLSGANDASSDDAVNESLRIELQDSGEVAHASFGVDSDESFSIQLPGDATTTAADSLSRSGIYFLLAKIVSQDDNSGANYDQIYLKVFESGVDTIAPSEDNMEWTLVGTTNTNSSGLIDRIALTGQSAATFSADEIRIGSSYAAVASTPVAAEGPEILIEGSASGGTDVTLSWIGGNGLFYGIQTNDDLSTGTWGTFTSNIPGDGGTITFTNTINATNMFFRLISE